MIIQALFGLGIFVTIGWLVSENRKGINWKATLGGLVAQMILAFLLTKVDVIRAIFLKISDGVSALKDATAAGTSFVFGYLGGGDVPFAVKEGANTFIFAFQPLPMVMIISALAMLLFHWRILPVIVKGFSWALQKTMGLGGALGVCAAAKVFLGQTEAPILIRPYLSKFSRSELFTVMTAGMATTSATIMVLYSTILEGIIANPISHILTASIISIPAAITISRLMIPQVTESTAGHLVMPYHFSGSMEAIAQGTSDGMRLFMNILAMLVVILALVALVNAGLSLLPAVGGEAITLQRGLGFLMAPLAWLMGIPWEEAMAAGSLLGKKTILNEVVAFIGLSEFPAGTLSPVTNLIMTYALCGFANLSSIGIQIGGIGTMVPERKQEIISLGFKAVAAGTIASCMSGAVVGILYNLGL